jgi:putative peptide zinc metalloprotease protein
MSPEAVALAPDAEAAALPAQRAPGVELLGRLSGSGYRRVPGLVRRGDGQTLQLTPLLYQLLAAVDGQRDEHALAEAVSADADVHLEGDDVRFLLDERLGPLGVLADPDGTAPSAHKANPLLALRFKFVVTDPDLTRRLTSPFARLFSPLLVVPALLAFGATVWWLLFEKGLAGPARHAIYEPGLLLTVFALTVASAAFHEFGHAAACRYGGATPGAMGGGLYLVWPAFYTDVDDSYRLSRWGRLRVDLGGLYFNVLFALAMTGAWLVLRQDALLLVVVTQLLQMVRQLAPFMRADGYHIIADLTGVPDLFAHIKPTLLGLWPTRWGRPESKALKPWARVVVTVWVLVVVPMLLGLLVLAVWLLPRLAATVWHSAGAQWEALSSAAADGDIVTVLARVLAFVALVLPVLAISYLLVRVVRRAWRSAWRASEGRPVRRALTVLVALLLAGAVAWAWWPNGQYTPVRADERGTIPSLVLPAPSDPAQAVAAQPATLQLPAVRPAAAVALVPRVPVGADRSAYPTMLMTSTSGSGSAAAAQRAGHEGLQTILVPTPGSGDGATMPGRVLPFLPPPTPSEGDNQALAIGTADGGVVYDVAYSLVWVTDGSAVENRNEAWALAGCAGCTTVAVAFQVVLVVGQSDVVTPLNAAVSANHECVECLTHAVAVQLIATLNGMPDEAVEHELALAWTQLDALRDELADLSVQEVYAGLMAVQRTILRTLASAGLLEVAGSTTATSAATPTTNGSDLSGPTAVPSADASPSPDAAPSSSGDSPTAEPTVAPSGSPSPEATPEPSPSASDSPSAETSPSAQEPEPGASTTTGSHDQQEAGPSSPPPTDDGAS